MGLLSRNTKPLLRMVEGREHATSEHHEEPPVQDNINGKEMDEEIDREPDSDNDDEEDNNDTSILGSTARGGRYSRKIRAPRRDTTKVVGSPSPSKRREDDKDDQIFSQSSQSQKRFKKTYKSSPQASYSKNKSAAPSFDKRFETPVAPCKPPTDTKAKFKQPLGESPDSSQPDAPAFRQPTSAAPVFRDPCSTEASSLSHSAVVLSSQLSEPSSPLSSIHESDIELVLDQPCKGTFACPICGDQVETEFRDNFQNDVCGGIRMNMRMQEKFCQAHKARNATQVWRTRGYPEIDWTGLQKRLEAHRAHLEAVLNGDFVSSYRKEHQKLVKSRKGDTAAQAINAGVSTLRAGYYGTRGEKLMADYIICGYSSKLRSLAASDKTIASMGTSGGISGFVHAVLVPELAVCLIMQDMNCGREEAMEIMANSADVGEMLNEEEDEKMPLVEVDHLDPPITEDDGDGRKKNKQDDQSKATSKASKNEDDGDEGSKKPEQKIRKEIMLFDDLSD